MNKSKKGKFMFNTIISNLSHEKNWIDYITQAQENAECVLTAHPITSFIDQTKKDENKETINSFKKKLNHIKVLNRRPQDLTGWTLLSDNDEIYNYSNDLTGHNINFGSMKLTFPKTKPDLYEGDLGYGMLYSRFNYIRENKSLASLLMGDEYKEEGYVVELNKKTESDDEFYSFGKINIVASKISKTDKNRFWFETLEECNNFVNYLNMDVVKATLIVIKRSNTIPFSKTPVISFKEKTSELRVCMKFDLTEQELDFIEKIKHE